MVKEKSALNPTDKKKKKICHFPINSLFQIKNIYQNSNWNYGIIIIMFHYLPKSVKSFLSHR